MSRSFTGGFIEASGAPARLPVGNTSTTYFLSCWIKPNVVNIDQSFWNRYNGIGPLLRVVNNALGFFVIDGGSQGREASPAATLSADVWSHICGGYNGGFEIKAGLNGVVGTTGIPPGFLHSTTAANWRFGLRGTGTNPANATCAELAMWNAYLTNSEIAALAAGESALRIRPGNLVGYWPLWGGETGPTIGTYSDEILADSPWLYWRLGESSGTNADDASPNNRDGTYNNSPTLAQTSALATDASNTSVSFDDTNDYVRSNAVFNSSPATVEVWYEYSGTPPASQAIIAGCIAGDGGAQTDKMLYLDSTGAVKFFVYDGGSKYTTMGSALTAGWHHLVGTVGNGLARCYVDGLEVGSVAASGSETSYGVNNVFVAGDSTFGIRLAGKRDEFAIYTSPLSASRIGAHYAAGSGLPNPALGLPDNSGGGSALHLYPTFGVAVGTQHPPINPYVMVPA